MEEKYIKKWKHSQFWLNFLWYFLILLLVFGNWYDFSTFKLILGFLGALFFVKSISFYFYKPEQHRFYFLIEHGLMVLASLIVVVFWEGSYQEFMWLWSDKMLVYSFFLYFLTLPASKIIKTIIAIWVPSMEQSDASSLENAGQYIGILERLLMFFFIVTNHWEGVGLLVGVKSIFRFGDLKESKDRKLTEYVLIGTLLSFSIALAISLIFLRIKSDYLH